MKRPSPVVLTALGAALLSVLGASLWFGGKRAGELESAAGQATREAALRLAVADSMSLVFAVERERLVAANADSIARRDAALRAAQRRSNLATAQGTAALESIRDILGDTAATVAALRTQLAADSLALSQLSESWEFERRATTTALQARDSAMARERSLFRLASDSISGVWRAAVDAEHEAGVKRTQLAFSRGKRAGRMEILGGIGLVAAALFVLKPF